MIKKLILKVLCLNVLFFLCVNLANSENKIEIELQIEDEILTNIDFLNEKKYLIALNNNLKNIPRNQLNRIAKESLIKEKIKKIELVKFYDLKKADKYSDRILNNFYKRLKFKNKDEFNSYLVSHGLNIKDVREKLKIETLWNEMIFSKYKDQVKVNEKKIKNKIRSQKKVVIEYNLSEILFQLDSADELSEKYNLILDNIKNSGFKSSANIFSLSDSAKFGGEIGWVSENQLNDALLKEIKNLNIDNLTKPIQTGGNYIIIKLNDKREKNSELDYEKAFNQMVTQEKNRQLNQFSLIYFNKIKQNIFISEK